MIEEPTSELLLSSETADNRFVVRVCGDVDSATAGQLAATIEAALEDCREIEIDMAELRFLDSTGLGVIADTLRHLEPVDGRLVLTNIPDMVDRLLTISDLRQFVVLRSAGDTP